MKEQIRFISKNWLNEFARLKFRSITIKVLNTIFILGSGLISSEVSASATAIGPQSPLIQTSITKGTLFTKPNGSGTTCSQAAPCNIWTAANKAKSGDVVFLRGGTYPVTSSLTLNNTGTAAAPVIYESYPGELAMLDGSQHQKGTQIYIRVTGKFIKLRNIEVKNMPLQGIWINGVDNIIDGAHVHHSGLGGIHVYSPYEPLPYGAYGSRNIIRNCTVHDNSGAGYADSVFDNGGNSDGISISSGVDNRIENNLVYHNSDDGIDTWRSIKSYVGYNIVHSNGIANGDGNGIKAGGKYPSRDTFVEFNLVYSNKTAGLDTNTGVNVTFSNNTTWNNTAGRDFGSDTIAKNNISAETTVWGSRGIETNNSWQRSGSVAFISLDSTSPNFLVPVSGSSFSNIGAYAFSTPISLLPDVIVTSVSYNSSTGIFTSVVKNQGTAATPAGVSVGVGYAVDGVYKTWGAMTVLPLAAGASTTISTNGAPYTIPDGTHSIMAYVDDINRFVESNETNNKLSKSVTLGVAN